MLRIPSSPIEAPDDIREKSSDWLPYHTEILHFTEICRKWDGNVRANYWGKWQKIEIFEKIWDPSMIGWRLSGQRAKRSVVKCYRHTSFFKRHRRKRLHN